MYEAKQATIAVVDDDAQMSQAIERLLNAAGFHVAAFRSAEDLLGDDATVTADCFVLDIQLPGISGFELQRRIALRRAGAPVIFITGHEDPSFRGRAQAAGAVALFTKPFQGQALLAAAARALGRQARTEGA